MPLTRYRPPPPLDAFVACLWWSRREAPQVHGEHMLPSGTAQLIFALHEAPFTCVSKRASTEPVVWSRGIVHGPQWGYYETGPKPAGAVVGVSFHPGMAGAVLGVPMTELAGLHVPIDALWGARASELRERLLAAGQPPAVFKVLEGELIARIARPLLIHPAIAAALAPHRNVRMSSRVGDLQRMTGYSARHFIALFRAAVGLTPKHYDRVQRFVSVATRLAIGDAGSLAGLAASAGYTDQSHLTREFRQFAGVTPTRYRPASPDSALHQVNNLQDAPPLLADHRPVTT